MRPGQIRVYDGLRITTEHLDHFQGSLHSAIQDLRELLGLGKVHSGFQVTIADDQTVKVQPGLAFDFQRNRLVCDEPQTIPVAFEPGQDTLFVCARYDQVEDGQSEGHYTLIWDSCAVVLRPTAPRDEENLVILAKLTRSEDGALTVAGVREEKPSTSDERSAEPVAVSSEVPVTSVGENAAPKTQEEAAGPSPGDTPTGPSAPAEPRSSAPRLEVTTT